MKKLLLVLALLMAFAPVALAEEAPKAETLRNEAPVAEVLDALPATDEQVVTEDVLDSDGLPVSALEIATEEASASYSCPPYTIYCSRDNQCHSYCGAPGAGVCEFGCCACLF